MPAQNSPASHLISSLDAAITNAVGENAILTTREPSAAGRLLARCQACRQWDIDRGCQRMERLAWVDLLITPGQVCRDMPA